MKNLLAIFLFTLSFSLSAQCVLNQVSCGVLTARLENIPEKIFSVRKNTDVTQSGDAARSELLTFVLEKEIAPGIWRSLSKKESNDFEASFLGIEEGSYRVTCVINNSNRQKRTRIHERDKQAFSFNFEGYTSNTISLTACGGAMVLNSAYHTRHISIFPNPVKNLLTIKGIPDEVESILALIHDLEGRQIFSGKFSGNTFNVDVSSFQNGIFFLQLKNEDNSFYVVKKIAILK